MSAVAPFVLPTISTFGIVLAGDFPAQMLKRLLFLLILAAGAWLLAPYIRDYFGRKELSPTARLSEFVDKHIDRVLGPVSQHSPPYNAHSIQKIREDIMDDARESSREEAQLYGSGIAICDTLLRAADERNAAISRISQIHAEIAPSSLAHRAPGETQDRKNFFEAGVVRVWNEKAALYRGVVRDHYALLRQEERRLK